MAELESAPSPNDRYVRFLTELTRAFLLAEALERDEDHSSIEEALGSGIASDFQLIGETKHAARGILLTLVVFRVVDPTQDIRYHKAEQSGGFPARSFDTRVTVPFLQSRSLPRSVESHWLTQTFSFAGPLTEGALKTTPKVVGRLLVELANVVQASDPELVQWMAVALLYRLIRERNRNQVTLTRPKNITIAEAVGLLRQHASRQYRSNSPRLAQLAVYATYKAVIGSSQRYTSWSLDPLMRMRTADRKAGTVGDVVVSAPSGPIEAAETKFGHAIEATEVAEAIEKVRTLSVERYYVLSTDGIMRADQDDINLMISKFRKSNGCEVIVGQIFQFSEGMCRTLRAPSDLTNAYADLVEVDSDLGYEHRVAWNQDCASLDATPLEAPAGPAPALDHA